MRIVVVGLAKSGTTALLYAIRAAMPADTEVLFEPRDPVELRAPNVAAKVLLDPDRPLGGDFYRQFERVVLIVRDPRDILVSKALYRVFGAKALHQDPERLDEYLELLRAKEADPRAVSLTQINATFLRLAGPSLHTDEGLTRLLSALVAFHEAFPGAVVFRYEDLVEGRFAELAQALSLPLDAMRAEVPAELGRVVRSRRAGNWRSWFCPIDVEHYRPLVAGFMERYGYADEWALDAAPAIAAEECSGYALRLLAERLG
jgi:hypothetical protein